MTVLGIDETRRGKGRYEIDTGTGGKVWVDRFDTGLVDISGTGGLFAQINGRTSKTVIDWIEAQDPTWRAGITHVAIDSGLQKCWKAKELLRHLLKLAGTEPDWTQVWRRLTDFQMFAADNIDIPQIRRLAQTVDDWRSSIIEGIFTGISNGRSEGYNRIVKHIGRIAFGFRNPANQKRRIRFACTRASRRVTTTLKP